MNANAPPQVKLTHTDAQGNARMVQVGHKAVTRRQATAQGWIHLSPAALQAVIERRAHKGDVLTVAQVAGIQAAKRTSDLIPLCHPLPLSGVEVVFTVDPEASRVVAQATVRVEGQTGVEMEALCAVSTALLTVYDMLKAVDRTMVLGGIQLLNKIGGRSHQEPRA